MNHPIRIEAAGILLRPSGHGWVVGYYRKGEKRERIRRPQYTHRLARAVGLFLTLLEGTVGEGRAGATAQLVSFHA